MKITDATKSMTYYISTDAPDFPEYRTDEFGENWENYLGGIWNPVFYPHDKELKELFHEYMKRDKLIKKWQTLLNSSNDATAMLIEPMEMEIKMDRE